MGSTVHALARQEDRWLTSSTYLELSLPECSRVRLYRSSANGSLRYAAQRGQEKPRRFRRSAELRQGILTVWLGGDCWICADRWDSSTTCQETNGSRFGAQKQECSVSMEIDAFVDEGNPAGTCGGVENWLAVVDAGLCGCAQGHSWVQLESRDSRSCCLFLC
ncbi:hypothetical protein TEA_017634 [Camellia sinensis var. sinensis]|uniref:Uncharacterized protein n=1 Tax=Camellia sinensis var. sinensis TaxID=542762 RepID=A0A4S4CVJ4_CAMSN|nr:hypothetical protein TEA_017634 [Camellia sinensis var. sinensis]